MSVKAKKYTRDEVLDYLKQHLPESELEGAIRKLGLDKGTNKQYYVFEVVRFDYLDVPDEEYKGLHVCIVTDDDGQEWFVGTDGINTALPCEDYYYYSEYPNEFLVIEVKEFEDYFDLLDDYLFDPDEFIKKAKVEIDWGSETIILYTDKYEVSFNFDDLDYPEGITSDLEKYIIENASCYLKHKIQDYVLDNYDVDYDTYELATRHHTSGILTVNGKEYSVFIDKTGNCYFGGFSISGDRDTYERYASFRGRRRQSSVRKIAMDFSEESKCFQIGNEIKDVAKNVHDRLRSSGYLYFEVPVPKFKELLREYEQYIKLEKYHGNSPSSDEFLRVAKPQDYIIGYLQCPEVAALLSKSQKVMKTHITITGLLVKKDKGDMMRALLLALKGNSLPDEFLDSGDYVRVWWD